MKKQLLQLTGIYTAAVISGVFAFTYISNGINALAVQPATRSTISTSKPSGQQRSVVGPNIQPAYIHSDIMLQPAVPVQYTINPQANQTGGNGQNYELQPAMGYGALNNTVIQ